LEFDFIATSAVVAMLLPAAISLLKNIGKTWNTQVVRVFAFGMAFVAAAFQVGIEQGWTFPLDWGMVIGAGALIYAVAQASFKGLYENTTTNDFLSSIANPEA
jgi:peptidoglycan/LPS O-acetylase OafA/YrhL